jgi:hypothetical protein
MLSFSQDQAEVNADRRGGQRLRQHGEVHLQQAAPTLQQDFGLGVLPQQARPRWQQSRRFSQQVTRSGAACTVADTAASKANATLKDAMNLKYMAHLQDQGRSPH